MSLNKLLTILGSTSTGKTDLALMLAKKFNGELVACDSRQVYAGLDIGTGKLPGGRWKIEDRRWKKRHSFWEIDGVKIWMYDVADFTGQYTVYDYVKDANRIIDDIVKRGKLPIVVGGTGLYLKALLEGLPNLSVPRDLKLRKELDKLSKDKLQNKLKQIALDKWNKLNESDKQNPRRLIRAIEIALTSEESLRVTVRGGFRDVLKIGLNAPREILYQRINERIISRMNQGMIKEAEKLHENGLSFERMKKLGLEYGVLADFLQGRILNKEDLVNIMQGKIHGFARRQITWFKKEKEVCWFDITDRGFAQKIERVVHKWYDNRIN